MIPCPFITVQLERDAASLITDIRVLTVNDAFLRIYGLSEQRWIGQSLLPFLRGPFRWLWKHIYEAINEKEVLPFRIIATACREKLRFR